MGIQRGDFSIGLSEDFVKMTEGTGLAAPDIHESVVKIEQPKVAILLCTYNGAKFLSKQLDSIQAQKNKNFQVYTSDDGSQDGTRLLLKQFQSRLGRDCVSLKSHPHVGVAENFLSLLCQPDIKADYYAYADQDDVWEADKLSRAIEKLEKIPSDCPALYCSRTSLIDEHDKNIGLFPLFMKPPAFSNALVQNIAGGNTMVMNRAARDLLRKAGVQPVVLHDWWTYLLITGAGGMIIYDTYPTVAYRQHGDNFHGANNGWWDRLTRLHLLLRGGFRDMVTKNTNALRKIRHLLTPENQKLLDEFCEAREHWLIPRILGLKKVGVYRQTILSNIALVIGIMFNKI